MPKKNDNLQPKKPKVPTHVRIHGQPMPILDAEGNRVVVPPWNDRSYKLWKSERERAGLHRVGLEMYLDACGYCTICEGRGQITDIPRQVFGQPLTIHYRPCPAKCRHGRVRNAWEPWFDPETGKPVQPTRYTPNGDADKESDNAN